MKTMMKALTLSIALGTTVPTITRAEEARAPITDLERFVGTWKAIGSVTMGKDTAKVAATWSCKRTSGRAGVACTLELTGIPGMAVYSETDLFGFEPNSNTYHWFAVTNAGETHDHVGKVTNGPKLQFVYTGTQETKPFKEVVDLEFGKDSRTLSLRAETFVAGASTTVFEIKAQK